MIQTRKFVLIFLNNFDGTYLLLFMISSRQSLSGSSRLSMIAPKNKDDSSPVSRTSSQSSLVGTSRTPSQSSIALPSRTPSQSSIRAPSRTSSQTSLAGMDSTPKRSSFVEVF